MATLFMLLFFNILNKFLTKNEKSITFDYDDWLRVALAIAGSFTYEVGLRYFIELSKMDGIKFNENNCKKIQNQSLFSI